MENINLIGGYMDLTLNQTKLVGLTMKLDLKTQEYKKLCQKLDDLKSQNIDENAPELIALRDEFQANHDEIVEINNQLKSLKQDCGDNLDTDSKRTSDQDDNFKEKNHHLDYQNSNSFKEENLADLPTINMKRNSWFDKVICKIKKFFSK